jgi:hypothetical protein
MTRVSFEIKKNHIYRTCKYFSLPSLCFIPLSFEMAFDVYKFIDQNKKKGASVTTQC